MSWRNRVIVGLLLNTTSCGRIIDADRDYGLTGGSGTAGGMGDTPCLKNDDCPTTGITCIANDCMDGFCRRQNAPPGTPCIPDQANVCNGQGECVQCTQAQHCVDISKNECTKSTCVSNTCQPEYSIVGAPASPALQEAGDCQIVVCDGFGGTKRIPDDTDTPNDDNGCTTDTCLNGMVTHANVATGTACGMNSNCNSSGQCIGCMEHSDCADTFDFCKEPTCQSSMCGIAYSAAGTALPADSQTPGDCFVIVCDGAGNHVAMIDPYDGPADGNACTRDECTSEGVPTYSPEPVGTPCSEGDDDACDGLGACKKSQGKPCTLDDECVSAHCSDGVCCENACTVTCKACNGTGTQGLCRNIPRGIKDDEATMTCNGTKACDGSGACKLANGQPCTWDNQCASGDCSGTSSEICQP